MKEQEFLIGRNVIFFDKRDERFKKAWVVGAMLVDYSEHGDPTQYIKYTLQPETYETVCIADEFVFGDAGEIADFIGDMLKGICSNHDEQCIDQYVGAVSFHLKEDML